MSWARTHIEALRRGETVSFRPRGNSMTPLIKSGELVTVAPASAWDLEVNDIALCTVHGCHYLHLVTAKTSRLRNGKMQHRLQISNNHGRVNRWASAVHGKVVAIGEGEVPGG